VEVRVNGATALNIPSRRLGTFLSKQVDCEIHLDICGTGRSANLVSRYEIKIRVPMDTELDAADKAFFTELAKTDVGLRDVEKFARQCEGLRSCGDYVSGLVDYVLGTLLKDRAGNVSLDFKEFLAKYHAAIVALDPYDRSLARITCSFMRFNLNDFLGSVVPCGVDELDAATAFFQKRAGLEGTQPPKQMKGLRGAKRVCPIDQTSETLLGTAANLNQAAIEITLENLTAVAERRMASGQDRAKAYVLLAELHLRSGRREEAAKAVRHLSNDPLFGPWAQKIDGV
jgi:hypothetical protein